MKRLALLLILFTVSVAGALGQTHYNSNICLGLHGGIDLSRVMFTPSVKQTWPVYPTLGVRFRYIEENHFGLVAEVNWVRKGWAEDFEGLPFRFNRSFDYIEIPALAHIYFGRRAKFFLNAGPQIGFRIGETVKSNFDPYQISGIPDFPNSKRRNTQLTEKVKQKIDYGISAGIGCEFNINRQNSIDLEGRFYFGLGNLFPDGRQDTFRASNFMAITISGGYWFRIK